MPTEPPLLPPIVSLDAIRQRLADLVLADVRWYLDGRSGEDAYLAGHIPGAIFVDLDADLSDHSLAPARGRHPWPAAELFAEKLGDLGIGRNATVVAYDDGGGTAAGRFVWMLRAVGQDAALLDGGLAAWTEADWTSGLETSPRTLPPTTYPTVDWPPELFVTADAVAAAAAAGGKVIDVRSADRFRGEAELIDQRAGHIPGAANLPLSGNTDPSGFFLDEAALAARFAEAGASAEDTAILHCGSGVSACQTLLAMEQTGLGRHRLFPGSWSEWSNDSNRPVATGPE